MCVLQANNALVGIYPWNLYSSSPKSLQLSFSGSSRTFVDNVISRLLVFQRAGFPSATIDRLSLYDLDSSYDIFAQYPGDSQPATYLRSLKKLKMCNCPISRATTQHLLQLTGLQELDLFGVLDQGEPLFLKNMHRLVGLKKLTLGDFPGAEEAGGGNRSNGNGRLAALFSSIQRLPSLTSLSFSQCTPPTALVASLSSLTGLKELVMDSACEKWPGDTAAALTAVGRLTALTRLELIGAECDVTPLLQQLAALTNLRELGMECWNGTHLESMAAMSSLTSLTLSMVAHGRLIELSPADFNCLRSLQRLAKLSVTTDQSPGIPCLKSIAAALPQINTLQLCMHVEDDDREADGLLQCVASFRKLRHLKLEEIEFPALALAHLASLPHLTSLYVRVDTCELLDEHMEQMACLDSLQDIDLDCEVTGSGIYWLRHLPKLQRVKANVKPKLSEEIRKMLPFIVLKH